MPLPILGLNAWNSYFCLAIGLFLNSLLCFVAKRHSSKNLAGYCNSIFVYCTLNCIFLFTQSILQPLFLIGNNPNDASGHFFILTAGPISNLPFPILHKICLIVGLFCMSKTSVGLGLQFANRYLVICHNHSNKFCRQFWLLAIGLLCTILCTSCALFGILFADSNSNLHFDVNFFDGENLEHIKSIAEYDTGNFLLKFLLILNAANAGLVNFSILFCFVRIQIFLRENLMENVAGINRKTLKQILSSMLIQALVPIYILSMALATPICAFILGANSPQWLLQVLLLIFAFLNWLPILNPLVTILTIKAYRNGAIRVLLKFQGERKKIVRSRVEIIQQKMKISA